MSEYAAIVPHAEVTDTLGKVVMCTVPESKFSHHGSDH
jgi:hypothetical protein